MSTALEILAKQNGFVIGSPEYDNLKKTLASIGLDQDVKLAAPAGRATRQPTAKSVILAFLEQHPEKRELMGVLFKAMHYDKLAASVASDAHEYVTIFSFVLTGEPEVAQFVAEFNEQFIEGQLVDIQIDNLAEISHECNKIVRRKKEELEEVVPPTPTKGKGKKEEVDHPL